MQEEAVKSATILIVDDQEANVRLLEAFLRREGYTNLTGITDPRQVRPLLAGTPPDLILLDLQMPHLDGFAVMEQIAPLVPPGSFLPILVLTADTTQETKRRALAAGASDFLTKPFDPTEVALRIANLLRTHFLHLRLEQQNEILEQTVLDRTRDLHRRDAILDAIGQAAQRFLKTGSWEQHIQDILAALGEAAGASRVYIYENTRRPNGALGAVPRYEWVAPGITPQIDNPEYLTFTWREGGFSRWEDVLSRGKVISGPVREFPDSEREGLVAQEIRSIAVVPIFVEEEWWGLIGFDDCLSERIWSPAEIDALKASAGTFGAAIQRQRAEKHIQRQFGRLAALRRVDMAITSSLDLRVTLNVFLDQVTTELHVDAAGVLLLNRHSQALEYAAGRGFRTRAIERSRLRLGEGLAGRAALERRILHAPNVAEARDFTRAQTLRDEGFVGYYGAPLIAKGEIVGVLDVFHRASLDPDPEWLEFLETLAGQAAIAIDSTRLFTDLQRSHADLSLAYDTTLEGWSKALDLRDKETEGHTLRVTELTLRLASMMGVREEELVHVRRGALLHDIGKMGIPDSILLKPGPLTDEEWTIMRKHPVYAHELLSPISYLRPALDIPYAHHEKWDGTGYPRSLKGEQIPLPARIFAAIDVWDALTSDRPYRKAWPKEKARDHIREQAGKHFDPRVVEAFVRLDL